MVNFAHEIDHQRGTCYLIDRIIKADLEKVKVDICGECRSENVLFTFICLMGEDAQLCLNKKIGILVADNGGRSTIFGCNICCVLGPIFDSRRNADTYAGEYFADKMHGFGVYSFANGHRYEGSWHEGRRQGLGMYTFRNGETQSGHWNNGILDIPSSHSATHPVSSVAVYHSRVLNAVQEARRAAEKAYDVAKVDERVNKAVAAANRSANAARVAAVKAVQKQRPNKSNGGPHPWTIENFALVAKYPSGQILAQDDLFTSGVIKSATYFHTVAPSQLSSGKGMEINDKNDAVIKMMQPYINSILFFLL
ncbi:membrane occupation and recognition nexus repeat-containing protein [Tanacetum coccineum]